MTLDEMKAIAAKRMRGEWHITDDPVHLEINYTVFAPNNSTDFINTTTKFETEFIAMASNNWDKLIAVAEAAEKALIACKYEYDEITPVDILEKALNALKGMP